VEKKKKKQERRNQKDEEPFHGATLDLHRIDHQNNRWMCRRTHVVGPSQIENLTIS
jgi:hypothetical protein